MACCTAQHRASRRAKPPAAAPQAKDERLAQQHAQLEEAARARGAQGKEMEELQARLAKAEAGNEAALAVRQVFCENLYRVW